MDCKYHGGRERFRFPWIPLCKDFYSRKNNRITRWFTSKKSQETIRRKIKEKTGNKALSAMTPWIAMKEVEIPLSR
jgi:hypothetical protein